MLNFSLGFSPHEAHAHQAFFGWIMPTIRTSEFTVLQIVGLDAAVVSSTMIREMFNLIILSFSTSSKWDFIYSPYVLCLQ